MKGGIDEVNHGEESNANMATTLKLGNHYPEETVYSEDVEMVTLPPWRVKLGFTHNTPR